MTIKLKIFKKFGLNDFRVEINLKINQEPVIQESLKQLNESTPDTDKTIIIAYEPVWAIGTNNTPTIEEISKITELIRTNKQTIVAKSLQIVYGGSVNSKNYKSITAIKDIGGVLLGGASLNKDELFRILNS